MPLPAASENNHAPPRASFAVTDLADGAQAPISRLGAPDARPRAYLQAGLHADEIPPLLTMVHLQKRLAAYEAEGRLHGRVTLVPIANPIGLSQRVLGEPQGRYDLADGTNFNRGFPDVFEAAERLLRSRETSGAAIDDCAARDALAAALDHETASHQTEALKLLLMRLALSADVVLDLHSNINATVHVMAHHAVAEPLLSLAARLGAKRMVPTDGSQTRRVFDEAIVLSRLCLNERFPEARVKLPTVATLELRGNRDVGHDAAAHDAGAILDFLTTQGVIGCAAPPADYWVSTVPSDSLASAAAPHPGIIVFHRQMGDQVESGELLAESSIPPRGARPC